jgi:hypothetical protein
MNVLDLTLLLNPLPILQIGSELGEGGAISFALEIAVGAFSIVLFLISIYAWWTKGKQPTLLIVSFAFLAFFIQQSLEIIPIGFLQSEAFGSIMDIIILGLFFLALVVRPNRKKRFS